MAERLQALASRLVAEFNEDSRDKEPLERTMLEDYRMYMGVIDPEILARIRPEHSKLYINKARVKTDTIVARLMSILFPRAGDRNWDIQATPKPQLDRASMAYIQRVRFERGDDAADALLKKVVDGRVARMRKTMCDQLAEAPDRVAYRATTRDIIRCACIYGLGVHKGPLVDERTRQTWKVQSFLDGNQVQRESWVLDQSPVELRPYYRSVSPWNFYWDMSAKKLKDCRRVWEKYFMVYGDVLELAGRPGFDRQAILEYLGKHREGDAVEEWYESDLRDIGNKNTEKPLLKHRFKVLERYGWLRGDELQDCGADLHGDPVEADYFCNVWLLGDQVIKATLSPIRGVEYPFQVYCISPDESGLCGQSVPRLYRHAQLGLNSIVRAMLDNTRLSCAPIIGLDENAFGQDEKLDDIYGGKIFKFQNAQDMAKAIQFFQAQSHTNDYLALQKFFDDAGDELTVPRWVHGDGNVSDAAKTLGGLSMLMSAMSINLAEMIKIFDDDVTAPFITALYFWNMDFNPDPSIKGDFNIVATGTTSLMAKEVQSQRLLQFLQLVQSNPQLSTMANVQELLRQIAVAMQIPAELVYDDATIQQKQQEQMVLQTQAEQQSKLETIVNEMNSRGITPDQSLQQLLGQVLQQLAASQQQPAAPDQPAAAGPAPAALHAVPQPPAGQGAGQPNMQEAA